MDVGGSMHGSFFREEHLALIFDLRGHLDDLEHQALLMGQRMDMFLDAFSNVPTKRKCPLCAQAFVLTVTKIYKYIKKQIILNLIGKRCVTTNTNI
jgi:hypothetical protein